MVGQRRKSQTFKVIEMNTQLTQIQLQLQLMLLGNRGSLAYDI